MNSVFVFILLPLPHSVSLLTNTAPSYTKVFVSPVSLHVILPCASLRVSLPKGFFVSGLHFCFHSVFATNLVRDSQCSGAANLSLSILRAVQVVDVPVRHTTYKRIFASHVFM